VPWTIFDDASYLGSKLMRLTSVMWFAVFMRHETQRGAYVSVIRTGAHEAGALFIIQKHQDETFSLHAPAPQAMLDDGGGRSFECVLASVSQENMDAYIDKQINFDPDLWVIETESGQGDPNFSFG